MNQSITETAEMVLAIREFAKQVGRVADAIYAQKLVAVGRARSERIRSRAAEHESVVDVPSLDRAHTPQTNKRHRRSSLELDMAAHKILQLLISSGQAMGAESIGKCVGMSTYQLMRPIKLLLRQNKIKTTGGTRRAMKYKFIQAEESMLTNMGNACKKEVDANERDQGR